MRVWSGRVWVRVVCEDGGEGVVRTEVRARWVRVEVRAWSMRAWSVRKNVRGKKGGTHLYVKGKTGPKEEGRPRADADEYENK